MSCGFASTPHSLVIHTPEHSGRFRMSRIKIKGSRALVTGATGGIGQGIARALAAEGAELVLSGRRVEVIEHLANELGAQVVAADLSDLADVARLLREAGPIDILVAN